MLICRSALIQLFFLLFVCSFSHAQEWYARTHVVLRSDSTIESKKIRVLPKNEKVAMLREPSDVTGFTRVRLKNGDEGWVYIGYLRPSDEIKTENPFLGTSTCGQLCGLERWPVKTATDQDAGQINEQPQSSTISILRSITAPAQKPKEKRVPPTELTTYVVDAYLVGWKLEGDRDLHLVMSDKKTGGKTMIIEIPNGQCHLACSSKYKTKFDQAYTTVTSKLGNPSSSYKTLTPRRPVKITGVGFFDFLHGQRGVAPNGIELHPVLAIQFK